MSYTIMAIIVSVILIFLGIAVLVLIHVCVVWRALRRGFGNENGLVRMSRDDLEKLPCFEYMVMMDKGNSSPVDCAVCLESFKAGEKCRLLPSCKHSFHAECVDEWLLVTPICPICRAETTSFKGSESCSHLSDLRGNDDDDADGSSLEMEESQRMGNRSNSEMGNHQTPPES